MKKHVTCYEFELSSVFGRYIYLNVNQLEKGRYTLFILYRKKIIATARFEKK